MAPRTCVEIETDHLAVAKARPDEGRLIQIGEIERPQRIGNDPVRRNADPHRLSHGRGAVGKLLHPVRPHSCKPSRSGSEVENLSIRPSKPVCVATSLP